MLIECKRCEAVIDAEIIQIFRIEFDDVPVYERKKSGESRITTHR